MRMIAITITIGNTGKDVVSAGVSFAGVTFTGVTFAGVVSAGR